MCVNLFIERRGGGGAGAMWLPSASQGPKGGNGGARRFDLRLRLRVTHLRQVAVGIQRFDQADDAPSVGCIRVLPRTRDDDPPCVRMATWASRLTRAEKVCEQVGDVAGSVNTQMVRNGRKSAVASKSVESGVDLDRD
jgi:hypothetical protein